MDEREEKLLQDLLEMLKDESEFKYSCLRGHWFSDDAENILEAVKIAVEALKERRKGA